MFMKGCLRFDGIGPRKITDSVDFRADSRNSKIRWIVARIPSVLCQPWIDPLSCLHFSHDTSRAADCYLNLVLSPGGRYCECREDS